MRYINDLAFIQRSQSIELFSRSPFTVSVYIARLTLTEQHYHIMPISTWLIVMTERMRKAPRYEAMVTLAENVKDIRIEDRECRSEKIAAQPASESNASTDSKEKRHRCIRYIAS